MNASVRGLLLAGLLAASTAAPGAPAAPRRAALLVGVDRYLSGTLQTLRGCVNDVERMRAVLVGKFGFAPEDVVVLRNEEATHARIVETFRKHLIEKTKPGDVALFHFSGHGSTMDDEPGGDEPDGIDETLVPYDSRQGDVYDLVDDELNALLNELASRTENVTVILDSCHSGSATRGGSLVRRAPHDPRKPPASLKRGAAGDGVKGMGPAQVPWVALSGCAPDELSNEYATSTGSFGALSYFLTAALESAGPESTYRDLFESVGPRVTAVYPSQHPRFEGARVDARLFGALTPSPEPFLLARGTGPGAVQVDGGETLGLATGARLDVYAPGTKRFAPPEIPLATVELREVDAFASRGAVVGGGNAVVPEASRAVIRSRLVGSGLVRVFFKDFAASAPEKKVRDAVLADGNAKEVASEADAQLLLARDGTSVRILAGDLEELSGPVPLDANAPGKLSDEVRRWQKWFTVLAIENVASGGGLTIELTRKGDAAAAPVRECRAGEKLRLRVRHASPTPLYLTVLDLESTGAVSPLYSDPNQSWVAGRTLELPLLMSVPPGRTRVTDRLKVLATSAPINASVFRNETTKAGFVPSTDSVAALIEQSLHGLKGAQVERLDSWTTADLTVRVTSTREAPPGVESFVIHPRKGARADAEKELAKVLPPCGPGVTGTCWRVSGFGGVLEAVPVGARSREARPPSPGEAWDAAYRIRGETNARWVEPVLDVDGSEWSSEGPRTRSGGSRPDKPGAREHPDWSLLQVRAPEAWAKIRSKHGSADGAEAKGIFVGHPDTGYRRHPEIWDADETRSPVAASLGWNFVDGNADALDPLDDSGLLPNPGHGTKSGSVIASPKGRQLPPGTGDFVTGVAPGARLMPLRVHRSVVHLSTVRLAKAIFAAAGDDRAEVKRKADVISISMGGLPSWSLWKAVRFARDMGVPVIAAAGNEVGFVVWPARFAEVVGVAATNVECGTWAGSSHGAAVDISAPGESVWEAEVARDGAYSIAMGQGTTYATATVAGIASLWLAYHAGESRLAELKAQGLTTDAFLFALRKRSFRPASPPGGVTCASTAWDPSAYGAGIADAAATLDEPLPEPASLREGARGEETAEPELPLFASLFPERTAPGVVRARFLALLQGTADELPDLSDLEAELTQLYARDAEVRAAFDALTGDAEPAPAAYDEARRVLRAKDVSSRLRSRTGARP